MRTRMVHGCVNTVLTLALAIFGISGPIWASNLPATGTEKLVHTFNGTRGQNANSALILDSTGNLYGTTASGGTYGLGIAYKLSSNGKGGWTETVLHNFGNSNQKDGSSPESALLLDSAGNLYGTTYSGGSLGWGIVYKLAPSGTKWSETVLHNFASGSDGANPVGGLVFDKSGNLYGTTLSGGSYTKGTAFKLTLSGSAWNASILWNFGSGADGTTPNGGLIFDSSGNLYGATANGGAKNYGMVFKLLPGSAGWTETDLHDFGHFQDGLYPLGTLVFDSAGVNLFGTTSSGGTRGFGTVFELSPAAGAWTENIIHNFTSGNDGWQPDAEQLVFDKSGNLYGTTLQGGSGSDGIVFELSPAGGGVWNETLMHAFTGGSDGAAPVAGVVLDSAGNLYGATNGGGTYGFGIVYEIIP